MAPRAYWSGNVRISLVTLPVRLYTATESTNQLTLHKIHRPTGERVRYQNVVPDHGPVENEDIVKGYEYEKGRYITLEPEEIENLRIELKKTMEIIQFVETHEIDPIYFERPYFTVPDGELAEEGFLVIRDALRQTRKIGLGQVVLGGRERIVALRPCGRGMMLETLRYADEVRDADRYFDEIEQIDVDEDQVSLAKELIERKIAPFDPSKFRDHYRTALKELIKAKVEEREPPEAEEREYAENVVDLMDALKRSVAGSKRTGASGSSKTKAKSSSRKAGGKTKSARTGRSGERKRKSA